jgi:hypothetical protein
MILKELETKGDSDTIFCSKLRLHLRTEVEKQFGWILEDTTDKNIYLLASCVDPRYGALEFLQSSDQKDAIWNTLFSNIKEMNLYGTEEEKKLRMSDSRMKVAQEKHLEAQIELLRATFESKKNEFANLTCPFDFWKTDKTFGLLHDYAKLQLCTMASSTPSERLFSSAGFVSQDRAMMDETNIEYAVMIRQNYHLIENIPLETLLDSLIAQKINVDNVLDLNFCEEDDKDVVDDVDNIDNEYKD